MPAGDEDLVDLAGVEVAAAQLDRPDAGAVLDGQVADDIAGQRQGEPLAPGVVLWLIGHTPSSGPRAGQVT